MVQWHWISQICIDLLMRNLHHRFLAFKFDPSTSAWIDDYCGNRRNWIHFSGVNIIQWANYKRVWQESNPRIKKKSPKKEQKKECLSAEWSLWLVRDPHTTKCWGAAPCPKWMLWKRAGTHKCDFNKLLEGAPKSSLPPQAAMGLSAGMLGAGWWVPGCRSPSEWLQAGLSPSASPETSRRPGFGRGSVGHGWPALAERKKAPISM